MASTSAPRSSAAYGRISTAASTLYSDNQTLIVEIRKATMMMKDTAMDLERDHKSEMVKELENSVLELVKASEDCTHLSNAIQSIGQEYQPRDEVTNFSKLFDDKIKGLKADSSTVAEKHMLVRQFREAIWNVHHAGQPMPGEEQEDIVMTSTESNLRNVTCPLTGKPVTELAEAVRSMDCKHIFEKKPIMQHIRSNQGRCPVAGCPKKLRVERVVCDPLLPIEIDELRSMSKQHTRDDVTLKLTMKKISTWVIVFFFACRS